MNEVYSILQRMRTLAVQGANDSNSPQARDNINTELIQLRDELKRIGKVTNLNGTELLNGSATARKALKFQVGANGTKNDHIAVDLKDAGVTKISQFTMDTPAGKVRATKAAIGEGPYSLNIEGKTLEFKIEDGKGKKADITKALKDVIKKATSEGFIVGDDQSVTADAAIDLTAKPAAGTYKLTIGGTEYSIDAKAGDTEQGSVVDRMDVELKGTGYSFEYTADKKLEISADDSVKDVQKDFKFEVPAGAIMGIATKSPIFPGKTGINHGSGFKFEAADGEIKLSRADSKNTGIKLDHSPMKAGNTPGIGDGAVTLTVLDANGGTLTAVEDYTEKKINAYLTVKSHDSARDLIRVLDQKTQSVSMARSNPDAVQNRFEYMITNLNVAVENLAASEPRVRNADMAQEMMQSIRNQILSQAGTSMSAQANQVPQDVLSLLR